MHAGTSVYVRKEDAAVGGGVMAGQCLGYAA